MIITSIALDGYFGNLSIAVSSVYFTSMLLKKSVCFGIFGRNMQENKQEQEGQLMKRTEQASRCIFEAYHALKREDYNPAGQLTGYLISGDPAYITSKGDARKQI